MSALARRGQMPLPEGHEADSDGDKPDKGDAGDSSDAKDSAEAPEND